MKNTYIETAFDEDENEMIMPWVDSEEWQKEYNRVVKYIDKDLDAHGNVIELNNTMPKNLVNTTYMDDLLDRIDRITEYFKIITEFMEGDGR